MEYYESPAAPPTVETSSLRMDLFRRDFTINTLALKLNKRQYGALVDYFGGQKDLKEKVIRVLHNLSFVEDPTRVLRAIRFEQRFGFRIGRLTHALIKNAVKINCFEELSGRRLFLELKLLLKEQVPLQAINRMNEFRLLQFISREIGFTKDLKTLLQEIEGVISWFNLLYLEEPYKPWKVYWHGLTSPLDTKALNRLAERMQMVDQESREMIRQREKMGGLLEKLYRMRADDNYELYTLLSHYDTESLLYIMARVNTEKIKRMISNYFTKLKGTKVMLRGKDLKGMGVKPGPVYKEIFDSLLKARLNNSIRTKEEEAGLVKEMFGSHMGTA
jgi:tRNA nucleotidyltransferase (CCA-adding enzyme)